MSQRTDYELVIGLETHIQLATESKIFCSDDAAFGAPPNSHISPVSLAHPGTLPRLNRKAVELAVQLGLALDCEISLFSAFDRKNYFYADLPKGYQITQDKHPICRGGQVFVPTKTPGFPEGRKIRIHHIHLEEDAGKSLHDQDPADSLIDLNRAGTPLVEIVSEPDFRAPDEVVSYMEKLRRLVRWLGISDGNMEEGSLRCDVNISVRRRGDSVFGQRCEIKNVNSMRFARKAIEFEFERQIEVLENGGRVGQETRGFDPATGRTFSLREKEDAHDYRYFPEPDLPPVVLSEGDLERLKSAMPVLPEVLEKRFCEEFGLTQSDAEQLAQERETADYFLAFQNPGGLVGPNFGKTVANFIIHRALPWAVSSGKTLADFPLSRPQIIDYLQLVESGKLSASTAAQRLLPALLANPGVSPEHLAAELNLLQSAETDFLESLVDDVLAKNPDKVREFQKGKKGLLAFFMGEVMRASKGRAAPEATTKLLAERLK